MSYSPEMVTMFIPLMKDLNLSWSEIKATPRVEIHGLAKALSEYATEGPPMIVDDVYTTGTSFTEYCNEHYRTMSFDYNPKWVAFARTKPEDRSGVRALFTMPYKLEQ